MRILKSLMLLVILTHSHNDSFGRVSLGNFPEKDSVMMVVRDVQEVDPKPFEQAYAEKVKGLNARLSKLDEYRETAEYYLFPPSPSDVGYGGLGGALAVASEIKKRHKVTTRKEKEFMGMIVKMATSSNDPKDAKEIEKKLSKGQLSDKAKPYINSFYADLGKFQQNIKDSLSRLATSRSRKGVVECMRSVYPKDNIETRMITVRDTVMNASYRPFLYISREKVAINQDEEMNPERAMVEDEARILGKWGGIYKSELSEAHENYPVSVYYYYSDEFPEYRMVKEGYADSDWIVYDKKGTLKAIPKFTTDKLSMDENDLRHGILAYAYKSNVKDIQNAGQHTKHYVKVQSGLESLTAKEKQASERASSAMADAILGSMKANMKYGSNSKKAKAAGRKSASKIVGTLAGGSDFYDSAGSGWIEDMKEMYGDILERPYKMERVNDTTFRCIYVDEEGKGLFEVIAEYRTGKPYSYVQNYKVNSLQGQRFFTPEEIARYKSLRAFL